MKKLMLLVMCITVVLLACNNKEDKKEQTKHSINNQNKDENEKDMTKNPAVKVKINKASDAKKKIEASRAKGAKYDSSEALAFNTERYNLAINCLTDTMLYSQPGCQQILNTQEYSRAWNNLTENGYICQNGHCTIPTETPQTETPQTETPYVPPTQSEPQTEAPYVPPTQSVPQTETLPPQTEAPFVPPTLTVPQTESKEPQSEENIPQTESPVTDAPTTEIIEESIESPS